MEEREGGGENGEGGEGREDVANHMIPHISHFWGPGKTV